MSGDKRITGNKNCNYQRKDGLVCKNFMEKSSKSCSLLVKFGRDLQLIKDEFIGNFDR